MSKKKKIKATNQERQERKEALKAEEEELRKRFMVAKEKLEEFKKMEAKAREATKPILSYLVNENLRDNLPALSSTIDMKIL